MQIIDFMLVHIRNQVNKKRKTRRAKSAWNNRISYAASFCPSSRLGQISAIDGNTYGIVNNISLAKDVYRSSMTIDPKRNILYVAMLQPRVLLIDAKTDSITGSIITGNESSSILRDILFDETTKTLYVIDSEHDTLLSFNSTNDLSSTIRV
jgi:DNA-binding beta-propeller fold protein YncE